VKFFKLIFSALGNLTTDEFWEQYNIKKNQLKMSLDFSVSKLTSAVAQILTL